ncbi:MAG: endonuclease/exonuclease/phosphatase family protein [Acidobacteriota bacterium]|nr:endonuclease/exonuclease/phosphatase family protein [Acidobacteriota bacterium]
MRRCLIATVLLLIASAVCAVERDGRESVRIATYNVQGVGAPESEQHEALVAVIERVDADVLLLQEIDAEFGDLEHIQAIARRTGHEHVCLSEISGTLSGDLHTACLSRFPLVGCFSRSAAALSSDPDANDITRDILEAHVAVEPGEDVWGFFVVHLKGGREERNVFRRQVEVRRIVQAIGSFARERPGSPIVLAGDLNEDLGDGRFGSEHETLPVGLPRTYRLGRDIAFPVVYGPFAAIRGRGLEPIDAFHEDDATDDATRLRSWRRLDYLFVNEHLAVDGAEVYDSCDDNGKDDPAPGRPLPKPGRPLPCKVTGRAADHLPVFADVSRRQ